MPIYKPSELRQFLSELNISPKKGLSQNFLIDGNIIRKIVSTAHVEKDDLVLEIGPGPGSLTEALLESGANVIAVEKDKTLAKALSRLKVDGRDLEIYCDDIMQFPIEETLSKLIKNGKKIKVIANLPYNITTPIISYLISKRDLFSSLTLMVQEEVARRFTAMPGTADYSSFTVFLNYYSIPRYGFTVSPHCFYPEPSIKSAIVVLDLKTPPDVSNVEGFFNMTRTAFGQRRKMLRASLKELYGSDQVEKALVACHLDPQIRPEKISLEQWIQFFEIINKGFN